MLGFLKPRGELVEISGRTVVFLSAKAYKPEQRFEVRLGLPAPSSEVVAVAVRVLNCRPGPGDFFVVVGSAEGRREPPEMKGYDIRAFPRWPHRISVKSEGLPGYRAVTSTLGRGGFGAELDGELTVGNIMSVHFEFDEPLGWTLDLKATVVWSAWRNGNRFDAGFAFLEDRLYEIALGQLNLWLEHRAKNELIPFKPPDKLPPRRPKDVPNQLPQTAAQKAAESWFESDDDPTPLGLPTLVQPVVRPASLKLPQTVKLERPSAFALPARESSPPDSSDKAVLSVKSPAQGCPTEATLEEPDLGVRLHFEAQLGGWAWEAVDDALVVVLEDVHGTDFWLEFRGARGIQARCRQREIRLKGLAVSQRSPLITELTRAGADPEECLMHFRFYDDHQRTVLEVVARECREQIR